MVAIYASAEAHELHVMEQFFADFMIPAACVGGHLGHADLAAKLPFVAFTEESAHSSDAFFMKTPPEKRVIFRAELSMIDEIQRRAFSMFGMDLTSDRSGYISFHGGGVFFFGMRVSLTVAEEMLLRVLSFVPDTYITPEELSMLAHISGGKKAVAVHICHINAKATALLGIPIIRSKRNYGYMLVEIF